MDDKMFEKVEKRTNVDKDTIMSLAHLVQENGLKDKKTLKEVISKLSKMTGREVSAELEDKIINTILEDKVPKNIDKLF